MSRVCNLCSKTIHKFVDKSKIIICESTKFHIFHCKCLSEYLFTTEPSVVIYDHWHKTGQLKCLCPNCDNDLPKNTLKTPRLHKSYTVFKRKLLKIQNEKKTIKQQIKQARIESYCKLDCTIDRIYKDIYNCTICYIPMSMQKSELQLFCTCCIKYVCPICKNNNPKHDSECSQIINIINSYIKKMYDKMYDKMDTYLVRENVIINCAIIRKLYKMYPFYSYNSLAYIVCQRYTTGVVQNTSIIYDTCVEICNVLSSDRVVKVPNFFFDLQPPINIIRKSNNIQKNKCLYHMTMNSIYETTQTLQQPYKNIVSDIMNELD